MSLPREVHHADTQANAIDEAKPGKRDKKIG